MTTIWVISDNHFGHANILNFKRHDGQPMRVFDDVHHMNEHMIKCWNEVVKAQDHVYNLGDVCVKREGGLDILARLNGHKRLVRGNHDIFKTKQYMQYFNEIYGVRILDNLIFSHIPLHPDSINQRWLACVHGHIHNNEANTSYTPRLGPRYFNASVEVLAYTPISLEEIKAQIKKWT